VNEAMNEDELRDYIVSLEDMVTDLEFEIKEYRDTSDALTIENKEVYEGIDKIQGKLNDFEEAQWYQEEHDWREQWDRDMGNASPGICGCFPHRDFSEEYGGV
jgi:hypothetical protein